MKKYVIHPFAFCFVLQQQSRKIVTFSFLLLCSPTIAWGSNSITDNQWQEDISVYREKLEQSHMNLFHTTSKERFYNKVKELRKQLPRLSDNEILVRLMIITRMVGDGHTSFPLWGAKLHKFPIRLITIDQRLFVSATTNDNQDLFKRELIAINGRPIAKIIKSLGELVPFADNHYSTQVRVAQYIPMAELLNGMGIIDADYSANFTFKESGTVIHKNLRANVSQDFVKAKPPDAFKPREKVATVNKFLWFAASANKGSVYVKFERYTNINRMEGFASSLLNFINKNQSENLIIDLSCVSAPKFFNKKA